MHVIAQLATSRGRNALLWALLTFGVLFGSLFFFLPSAYAAAPTGFTSQTYQDNNGDGTIDRIVVVVNGGVALTSCTVDATELGTDWTYTGGATFGGTIASATCDTATATITFVITGATASVTGGGTAPTIAYDNDDADNSIANAAGNLGTVAAQSATDGAAPVIVSVSPTQSSVSVSRTASVVVTFSEAMDPNFDYATEFSTSPATSTFTYTDTWSSGNTVVTLTYTNGSLICVGTYTVTLVPAQINAAAGTSTQLVTTGPQDETWSFTTRPCSAPATEESTSQSVVYGLHLASPNGGESLTPGAAHTITWTDTSTGGIVPYVNLSYSLDNGAYVTIANNVANNGSYKWTVPQAQGSVRIKIEGTDLSTVLATDTSDAAATIVKTEQTPTPESPVIEEPVDHLNPGTFIKGKSFSAVYYVGNDGMRHPFMNSTIYFTWADSFDGVVTVSDEELASYKLGSPMLPKPFTVFVKLESLPNVYVVGEDDTLQWITSEAVAREIAGADWADYIIDLPITLWPKFTIGEDIDSSNADIGTRLDLRSRAWLHSQAE